MLFLLMSCTKETAEQESPDSPVLINEVQPGGAPAWVELYNPLGTPVSLSGLVLLSGEQEYLLPAGDSIPAGGLYMVWFGGDTLASPHAAMSLPQEGGALKITDLGGNIIDKLVYPGLPVPQSFGRFTDGSDHWNVNQFPTPGRKNDSQANHPPNIYNVRVVPSGLGSGEPYYVHAEITDVTFVEFTWLHFSYPGFDTVVHMSSFSCGTGFRATIAPLAAGTEVKFYISALDPEIETRYPLTAPVDRLAFTAR